MPSRNKLLWPAVAVLVVAALTVARMFSAPASTEGGKGGGASDAKEGKESKDAGGSKDGKGGGSSGGGGKSGAPRQLEVSIQVLKPQPLARKVLSSGSLLAREDVDLKTETAGRITAIRFREGAKVKKGDLLVKLNDAELKAQLRKIETQLALSEAKEARQKVLAARDLVSKEEYEIAETEKNGLLADRDVLRAQLAQTEIHAPFDGVVGLKETSEGSNVAAGTKIAGLFSLDPLKIDFSIPEQYFGQAKAGDSILISIEGQPKPVKGIVYAVEPKVDPATRMLRIRGYCPNGQGLIAPGASARVELPLRVIPDAILVPSNALLPDIRGQKVMLYKGGKAVAVPVASLYRSEDQVQIGGVSPGDSLIVSGLIQIKAGSPVKLAQDKPADGSGGPGGGVPRRLARDSAAALKDTLREGT